MYTYTHKYSHPHAYIYTYRYMYIYAQVYIYTQIYTCTQDEERHSHRSTYTNIPYIYTYIQVHTCMHTYTYAYAHIYPCIQTFVYIHSDTCIYMHVNTYMQTHKDMHTYTQMHQIQMHSHIHRHTSILLSPFLGSQQRTKKLPTEGVGIQSHGIWASGNGALSVEPRYDC